MNAVVAGRGIAGLVRTDLLIERALIGGAWVAASSGGRLTVTDPVDDVAIGTVPACDDVDTNRAIEAADAALPDWRARTAGERCAILERWHALVMENVDDLARIMTAEQGKPLPEAAGEIRYAATFIKWFAEEGRRVSGHDVPAPTRDRRILVRKEPIGVCTAITPWNFPAAMITRKVAPALAAGCTMIVKPSELTPFTALAIAALAQEAGLPAGVLNVVTGLPESIGAALTASPVVRKLSFTGSTRVGSLLMRQCADTVKKLSLELGGNAPFIVFDDADLDLAVEGAMASKFRNAGQTCVCANRLLVQSGIHDAFVARLGQAVAALRVGSGTAEGTTIGPLINAAAKAKVAAHIADALSNGASIAASAEAPEGYTQPVVLTGATETMLLASEETFGPVAPIFRFEDEKEAIAFANATPYGLAAYFYTNDLHRAWRVGEALDFGMVGLNTGTLAMEMAPFGGTKQSGLGREGGAEGIEEYLEIKTFHWAGLKPAA
ncbi:succinate-semialdehyde dehydrogenase/glutarate-semialdehyde dehydrogenase [Sphingobium sp. B11D3B]|uniref:NAD-dependent succinate-semialdehyde dehydrogenase n=1 Tax=Sphingobium sp. B11D3B TaxID=2940575 RepID=UPI00222674E8|nr:NAD-dependent succinate-semialdehyde dehydrogenase [Sphingobium sp. B11D3B]MCW2387321.1 succinate-semialdehyde dehydrogenase/glutarate-semialdehyde dehydrogenase [Sphingobium sp. B11D3B]